MPGRRPARAFLAAALAAALAVVSRPARAEHLLVPTPPDWAVTTLPAPEEDGRTALGERRRATLPGPDDRPLATVEVVELPQVSDQTGQLPAMLRQAVEVATQRYAGAGIEDRCEAAQPLQVAGQPALGAECTAYRGAQPVLGQMVIIMVTPASLYGITYSAGAADYRTHEAVFRAALAAARLQ